MDLTCMSNAEETGRWSEMSTSQRRYELGTGVTFSIRSAPVDRRSACVRPKVASAASSRYSIRSHQAGERRFAELS